MQVTPYYLSPEATLHIGRQGIEQEQTRHHAPADTLFAALMVAAMEGGCPPEVWADALATAQDAPFLMGSAFPYAGGVRFYPRPQVNLAAYGLPPDEMKRLRRIAYVSQGIWERIAQGQPLTRLFPNRDAEPEGALLQGGTLWLTAQEVADLPSEMRTLSAKGGGRARPLHALEQLAVWKDDQMPRVTVDRWQRGSEIYYTGRVAFAPGCGLWFPVAWRRPDAAAHGSMAWRALFERALSLLADAGLGGERSAGLGGFSWRAGDDERWPDAKQGATAMTLSRYHPRADELPAALRGEAVSYRLTSVAGYLRSPERPAQRRRRLWLVEEGSVITATEPRGMGDLTNVMPQVGEFPHPVWRYGLAFLVPLEVRHA